MASNSLDGSPGKPITEAFQGGSKRKHSQMQIGKATESSSVRRRITRACDQCNQLRTKCDGKQPCAHCVDNGLNCDYARTHKKRGRIPKKEVDGNGNNNLPRYDMVDDSCYNFEGSSILSQNLYQSTNGASRTSPTNTQAASQHEGSAQIEHLNGANTDIPDMFQNTASITKAGGPFVASNNLDYANLEGNNYSTGQHGANFFGFPMGDEYSVAFMGKAPVVESPDWLMMTPTVTLGEPLSGTFSVPEGFKYPVLLPLLPDLESLIPPQLACDLLEQYFTSVNTHLRPKNPYMIGSILRKQSVLHPTNPRPCSSALLASMLWISAQHSDAVFLTSQPNARSFTCQKLLQLAISMLKPLVHSHNSQPGTHDLPQASTAQVDIGLAGLVSSIDPLGNPTASRAQLDNIITYMHLGIVVSASERKAASLRWWNAAWSLARELRLGRELPDDISKDQVSGHFGTTQSIRNQSSMENSSPIDQVTDPRKILPMEEYREERRRVWWLLYMTDRHLALCYNRPMFFLNQECASLLRPVNDEVWQSDLFESLARSDRKHGLDLRCTSHSVFGYFLPLMIILGEILDLNYARNRPQLGKRKSALRDWAANVEEIIHHLEEFEESIREFEGTGANMLMMQYSKHESPSSQLSNTTKSYDAAEARLQTDTVVAYSRHIMHVLHILLTGKWDPIGLLDDNDLWISSQAFVTATGHAVDAANDLADIIEYDPDLSLIPYFFGIYLLQGSFLLLLFADKLQDNISADVVKACETIVRAHEACVATLDTQYQRNFRKVMRSALQQLRGRVREDPVEQQNWRRGILKLYRWTGDGTGLAL